MRIFAIFILAVMLMMSCGSKNKLPSDILPREKMQAVLWDIMRADQFVSDYLVSKNPGINKNAETFKYYQQIFSLHKITEEQFKHSFDYYRDHPDLLKQVMDSINVSKTDSVKRPVTTDTVVHHTAGDSLKKPTIDSLKRRVSPSFRDSLRKRRMKRLVIPGPPVQ